MSQTDIEAYIAQLSLMEIRVLTIAKTHLESSFNIAKSIGFIEWQKKHKAIAEHKAEQSTMHDLATQQFVAEQKKLAQEIDQVKQRRLVIKPAVAKL